jgi:hypothetical protein
MATAPTPETRLSPLSRIARSRFTVWLLLAVAVVAPLWHIHLINREMQPEKADMVPVWVAARVALAGGDPYSADATRQIQTAYYGRALRPSDNVNKMTFAYPAHTLVLFSAIAPFSWPVLRIIFFILLPVLMAVSAILWLRILGVTFSVQRYAIVALLAVFSWPAMWGIRLAQPTLIVFALVSCGCFLMQRSNFWAAGILLGVSTMKPQLVAPLLLWLCVWAILRRRWSFVLSLSLTTITLVACASRLVPGWIPQWRAAASDYLAYRHLHPTWCICSAQWPD